MSALHCGHDFKIARRVCRNEWKSGLRMGGEGRSAPRRNGHVSGGCVCLVLPLISGISGSQKPLPAVTETITVPPSQRIYVALINSLYICNEVHTLIERWKRMTCLI